VTGWDQAFNGDVLNDSATQQLAAGNQHVVSGVQANKGCHEFGLAREGQSGAPTLKEMA
jgi:hypothetical protein